MNILPCTHRCDYHRAALSPLLVAQLLIALMLCSVAINAQEINAGSKAMQDYSLEPGKSVEREIAGGEAHYYTLTLQPGQFLRALLSPRAVDMSATLAGPGEEKWLTIDLLKYPGPEPISFLAEKAGTYRLEVTAHALPALRSRYELTSEVKAAASVADKDRLSAERMLVEALTFEREGSKESLQRSLNRRDESLVLWRKLGDKYWEAMTLSGIAAVYDTLGNIQKALEFYGDALPLQRTTADKPGEALTLNNIGIALDKLGERQKALEYYNRSLTISRALGDKGLEGRTLNNIGNAYNLLGEREKALEVFKQALSLRRAVGDKRGEGITLNNLGNIYNSLGDQRKALEYFNQSLLLSRDVGNKRSEANTLNNIAKIHGIAGEQRKALEFFNQALPLTRAIGDKRGEAITLLNIGVTYDKLGEKSKALEFFNQALPLSRALGDRLNEANTLFDIGGVHSTLGDKQKALEHYNQALTIQRSIEDKSGEAFTLGDLMHLWDKDRPSLAIFYGKQAVNAHQQLRSNIQGLDKNLQKSYLQTIEVHYRRLADLLVTAGRLPEAQQVLAMLKEEEYFDFVRGDLNISPLTVRATLTSDEAKLEAEYNKLADQITLIGRQRGELFGKKERTVEEDRLLAQLDEQLSIATDHFQKFLEQLQVRLGEETAKGARVVEVKDALGMKKSLRELGAGTVLLYTLVGADKYRVMLVTPDSEQAYENATSAIELQRKVLAFREALQDRDADPVPLARELFQILIGPKLAQDLKQAGATTLMWSLDGVLRYLPIAALHDGQKYFVESYRNVIFTPASRDRLKDPVSPQWKGLGLGVSRSRRVEFNGQMVTFKPLPSVPKELRSIIRDTSATPPPTNGDGVLAGRVILDASFTKDAMKSALRQQFQLVHIASHFVFQPGNETSSFLLLGDSDPRNDKLTLEEVKKVSFEGVDLLTLSACETALGGKQGNGVEVESFGVLAQRQGAMSVMATLWPVADESTSILMREFYHIRETTPGITKAEALRRAQLSFLRSKAPKQTSTSANANWRHPYYWAPFILIGNWR